MDDESIAITPKNKRDRFLRVAQGRTVKVLRAIRILGRCSNKSSYEYTAADVEKIFAAVQEELDDAKRKFSGEKAVKFSL